MATYTSNYAWTKPAYGDDVDIAVLNGNLDDQDRVIHNAFLNMAEPFSELSTYAVDDIVLYGTTTYKCHTAVATAGAWTGSTNWQVYKLSEGGGGGGTSDYSALNNKPQINGVTLTGNKTTGDLNIDYNDLKNKPTIPSAQVQSDWNQTDSSKADYIKNKPALGTAAAKSVPTSGDAGSGEVVMGNDSRLSDSRPASDVSSWAKQATKPTYTASEVGAIPSTDKGANGGVAELDSNGKVPSSQLPSYVDDTIEGYLYNGKWYSDSQHTEEIAGESGKIYVELVTDKTYRWSGTVFTEISASLALGETSSTAYRGDRGKTAYDHSQIFSGNPHGTTASDVGLGNVPNVSTNDQTPTFTEASTRNNIASGEKLSIILGKIAKIFNDLKTVAFSGNASDLNYDNTDSGLSATDVQGAVDEINNKIGTKKVLATATADGVKTLSVMLDELYPYRQVGAIIQVSGYAIFNTRYSNRFGCVSSDGSGNPVIRSVLLTASGSVIKTCELETGIISDQSANVPEAGTTIELYILL